MNTLIAHANSVSDQLFGELDENSAPDAVSVTAPVLATTAIALGVAVGAAAFHAGYMFGVARAMAEGKHPVPR
ncbi:hypothetical protein [Actinokineospora sp. NPDC004072]